MRQIELRYGGACARCGAALEVGQPAMYEKSTGIFCPGCEPKDVKEIREYRTVKAQAKADRLLNKADRLRTEADAKMSGFNSMRGDIAFLTQPGHIPARERMMRSYDKGIELKEEAKEAERRADGIMYYKTRVKGDTERERQAKREENDRLIQVGDTVECPLHGRGKILKINKKTYTIKFQWPTPIPTDKSWVRKIG